MTGRTIWAREAAAAIMSDLRGRGEFCYTLQPTPRTDGGPWASPETQAAIEDRIAELVDAAVLPRINGLLAANNREVERRRSAERVETSRER